MSIKTYKYFKNPASYTATKLGPVLYDWSSLLHKRRGRGQWFIMHKLKIMKDTANTAKQLSFHSKLSCCFSLPDFRHFAFIYHWAVCIRLRVWLWVFVGFFCGGEGKKKKKKENSTNQKNKTKPKTNTRDLKITCFSSLQIYLSLGSSNMSTFEMGPAEKNTIVGPCHHQNLTKSFPNLHQC